MTIHIEHLEFLCIIGILDFERTKEQAVEVNLTINYDYKDKYIDYAIVCELIKSEMKKHKFLLIEEALEHLTTILKENFSLISDLNLKITKPSILPDAKVSVSNFKSFKS